MPGSSGNPSSPKQKGKQQLLRPKRKNTAILTGTVMKNFDLLLVEKAKVPVLTKDTTVL